MVSATSGEKIDTLLQEAARLRRTEPQRCLTLLDEADRLIATEASPKLQVKVLRLLAAVQHETGDVERSQATLARILPSEDPRVQAEIALTHGWLAYLRGDLESALNYTQSSVQIAQEAGEIEEILLWATNNLGLIYKALGASELALAQYVKVRTEAHRSGNAQIEGGALANLCEIHLERNDWVAALETAKESLPLAEAAEDAYLLITVYGNLIQAYIGLKRLEDAWEVLRQMGQLPRPLPICEVIFWRNRAALLRLRGRTNEALEALHQATQGAQRGKLAEIEIQLARENASTLALSDPSAALEVALAALRRAEVLGLHQEKLNLNDQIAGLAEATGQWKLALMHLRRWQCLQAEFQARNSERQRILVSVELSLESARRETARERQRSALLEEKAARDGMTGLYNHATFQKHLQNRLIEKMPTTLIFCDVDNFKHYNDTYGHVAGDTLLRDLAVLLSSAVRGSDLLARYGGEEFALVARGDLTLGQELGERLRRLVEAHSFEMSSVTMSVGVAAAPPCASNPSALVEAADQALYIAKRSGKNRVCLAPAGKL